jgi:two-component system response regulator VicR
MSTTRGRDDGARATPEQMERKHVYMLNGSPELLDVIRVLLQDENYNVTTTNFVTQSFATIEVAQPDLLLIDLALGEVAGWDLLDHLQAAASTREIPIVLMSTTPRLLTQAHHAAADLVKHRYLVKPFDLENLLRMIREMIGTA